MKFVALWMGGGIDQPDHRIPSPAVSRSGNRVPE